ncbi:hypothetical protein C4K14_6517 [Pseudomonas chlororaphis subsp. aureofaciens]|uniref:hypothetical protein n=1 Tax=Pseudomonas chlororaphis TaxID=587753 RepID=UPI000F55B92B|nr:hypothetical protein [Pseudomonas chlororaphis]AZD89296.1 hypothetical protein C4K14_6517 [Pseudomonas chlororaphis subsp. aureofaciens]
MVENESYMECGISKIATWKNMLLIFLMFFSCVGLSWGGAGLQYPEITSLPFAIEKTIAKENEVDVKDAHQLPEGTFKWEGGYISAISFEDSIKNCVVYVFNNESLSLLFSSAPCEFSSGPQIDSSRKTSMPDILYRVKIFLPNRGAMVDEVLAFYFDGERKTYCESRFLGDWYETGNRKIEPDVSDGKCE